MLCVTVETVWTSPGRTLTNTSCEMHLLEIRGARVVSHGVSAVGNAEKTSVMANALVHANLGPCRVTATSIVQ